MKAAFYERTGPAGRLLSFGDLPDPQPASGQVRVRMKWSGVNPSDVKARSGSRGPTMPFPKVIPHSDGMGVVDAAGAGVDPARIGQRVWLWNAAWGRPDGTAAALVVLPEQQAVPLPDNVPDVVGACLGIPALTAAHAVLTDGGVAGQRVLIAGGAGAVGHYAVVCPPALRKPSHHDGEFLCQGRIGKCRRRPCGHRLPNRERRGTHSSSRVRVGADYGRTGALAR